MRKPRLRKVVHNIKKQRKLKVSIAEFLVDVGPKNHDLKKMLLYGHRGLLAEAEENLCKRFDQLYDELIDMEKDARKKYEDELKSNSRYISSRYEDNLKDLDAKIKRAQAIYNVIFEEAVFGES